MERFVGRRTRLHELQYRATRLREKPLAWSLLVVGGANVAVFWSLASAAASGRIDLGQTVVFAQVAVGVSAIAFGGLSWALDGAAAPVAAVMRLEGGMVARALSPPPAGRRGAPLACRRARSASAT
jgi:ATP-binding cassette subfamily B protein